MNPRVAAGTGALVLGLVGAYFWTGSGGGQLGLAVGKCGISITAPARARDGKVYLRSGQSLTLALTGTATRCPNTTITRRFNDGGSASITVSDAGTWTDNPTVADGVVTTITISSVDGGSAPLVVDALTTAPRVVVNAPTRDDWNTWYLVASKVDAGCGSGGNINAERFARSGFISDISCADGGQFNPSVTITGASGGWLSVTWAGVPLVDAGIASSPATLTQAQLGTLTLPELSMGELTFSATSSGGATTSVTTYATVRTLSPPALRGPDGGAPELTLLNARRASVQVGYVLPHVPEEIGAAHTEFVWTTGSVRCGAGGNSSPDSNSCFAREDTDAGFFSVVNMVSGTVALVCGSVAVPDGGCAYGSQRIWVKTDGGYSSADLNGIFPEPGDRLGVAVFARNTNCAGSIIEINPREQCVSRYGRPPANALNMADGGGSVRDFWDAYYFPEGSARVLGEYPVFDPLTVLYPSNSSAVSGYLEMRRELQDCQLYDAEISPQSWKCADGTMAYEGQVRNGLVTLPPINNYAIIPVLSW